MGLATYDALSPLVERLKAAAQTRGVVETAQVTLLNLGDILKRAGQSLRDVSQRVREGSAHFIRGCLDEDDVVIPCGEGFVIMFAHGDPVANKRRCAELQDLLVAFYAGEEGLEALRAEVCHRTLDSEGLSDLIISSEASARTPDAPQPPPKSPFVFVPVWSIKASVVACHFCAARDTYTGRTRLTHDERFQLTGSNSSQDYVDLDNDMLEATQNHLTEIASAGGSRVIGASVHLSTLRRHKTRAPYLARLATTPPHLARFLVIKIAEIDNGTPESVIAELTSQIRGTVRQVALGFHHSEGALTRLQATGAWSMGFRLPSMDSGQMRTLMSRWRHAADRAKLRLFVDGFSSRAGLQDAADFSADFATSEGLWPAVHSLAA